VSLAWKRKVLESKAQGVWGKCGARLLYIYLSLYTKLLHAIWYSVSSSGEFEYEKAGK
jgi:hypothetical protein